MKLLSAVVTFATLSLLVVPSFALSREETAEKLMIEDSYEAPQGQIFNEENYLNGTSTFKEYTNVIVINKKDKGPGAQTLRMYSKGQLILTTKVSTGVESLEYVTGIAGFFRKFGRGATQSHWRHTTRGVYTIKRVEAGDYRSGENNFHMPFAMFFNDKRGLAVHQVPPDLKGGEAAGENALGHRASSGCIRVHKNTIQQIHTAVVEAGTGETPVLDSKTGEYVKQANGQQALQNGYKSIVIVEEY